MSKNKNSKAATDGSNRLFDFGTSELTRSGYGEVLVIQRVSGTKNGIYFGWDPAEFNGNQIRLIVNNGSNNVVIDTWNEPNPFPVYYGSTGRMEVTSYVVSNASYTEVQCNPNSGSPANQKNATLTHIHKNIPNQNFPITITMQEDDIKTFEWLLRWLRKIVIFLRRLFLR